jgi:hypothetical protein
MKQTRAQVERVRRVNDTHQQITLAIDSSLGGMKAGQALLARPAGADVWSPYLRETWFPAALHKSWLAVERPAHERYEPGQSIDLIGPVGKPLRFKRTLRNVLLVVYDTDPGPLLLTMPALVANQVSVTLLMLGSAVEYGTEHLPAEIEIVKGDAGLNWPDRVTTVGWADQVFCVAARDDETARLARLLALFRELRADIPANFLFGVFRPPLPCGTGACQSCLVRQRGGGLSAICTDGPAYDLTTLQW